MSIIKHAKNENREKGCGIYYEKHHILPKSLFSKWKKEEKNLILLTAREHFFCHQLLTKIYPSNKMFYALWRLANDNQNNYCVKGSREYERIKLTWIKLLSVPFISRFGEEKAKEIIKKRSLAMTGRKQSEQEIFKRANSPKFKEGIKRASEKRKGTHKPEEEKLQISKTMKIVQKKKYDTFHYNLNQPIICLNTLQIFKNYWEASLILKLSSGNLQKVLKKERRVCNNLFWEYYNKDKGLDFYENLFKEISLNYKEVKVSTKGRPYIRYLKK
jgi:hypothetical protein